MSRQVVVTGGASFIGSHLVDALLAQGEEVAIIDDFSSGKIENLKESVDFVEIFEQDLLDRERTYRIIKHVKPDVLYHLAADHGGRGYVDLQQVDCSNNFAIDQNVFQVARRAEVGRIIFASSGCIYPIRVQQDVSKSLFLTEEDDGRKEGYDADGLYGWAKLMAELTLRQIWLQDGIRSCCCRLFTVYGPRGKENHAVMAMLARAFIRQDPFYIWGDGTQVRNWTYVEDIVKGLLRSEALADQSGWDVVNVGTEERITVQDAAIWATQLAEYEPKFIYQTDKPVGPLNRVASNRRMREELEILPLPFREGIKRTAEWYFKTKDRKWIRENLEKLLVSRS